MTKKKFAKAIMICAIGTLLISACKDKTKIYAQNDEIFKNMDTTVKPGGNFFNYANGGWLKKTPIPAAYSSWGIGNVVIEELRDRLKPCVPALKSILKAELDERKNQAKGP